MPKHFLREKVDQIIRDVDLWEMKHKNATELSGGMRRRLALGISLAGNPSIIILDEPTTGLDPMTKENLWKIFIKLKETKSIILSTHSMDEADKLCDRIGILIKGTLSQVGTPRELKSIYASGSVITVKFSSDIIDIPGLRNLPEWTFSENIAFKVETSHSSIIRQLASLKAQGKIIDWGMNVSELDQVFMSCVQSYE